MIVTMSVSASMYMISQDQSSLTVTYYALNTPVETESSSTRYSQEELYTKLFNWALEYQNSREVENE